MTAIAEHIPTISAIDSLKVRRIEVKMTARCLFGAPDPVQCEQLVAKVHDTKRWAFERKWNFSIEKESQLAPNPQPENFYQWPETFGSDHMEKCDSNHLKGQGVPSRVTLLSAPIILDELPENMEDSLEGVKMDLTDSSKTVLLPNNLPEPRTERNDCPASTGGKVPARNPFTPSPSNSRSRRNSPIYDRDNSRSPPGDYLIFPTLKQRCITDYMKIKKIPPRMKKIRCRE